MVSTVEIKEAFGQALEIKKIPESLEKIADYFVKGKLVKDLADVFEQQRTNNQKKHMATAIDVDNYEFQAKDVGEVVKEFRDIGRRLSNQCNVRLPVQVFEGYSGSMNNKNYKHFDLQDLIEYLNAYISETDNTIKSNTFYELDQLVSEHTEDNEKYQDLHKALTTLLQKAFDKLDDISC